MFPPLIGVFIGLAGCGEAPTRKLDFRGGPEFIETPSGEYVGDVLVKSVSGIAEKPRMGGVPRRSDPRVQR